MGLPAPDPAFVRSRDAQSADISRWEWWSNRLAAGDGEPCTPAVLVHGDLFGPAATWRCQRPLADDRDIVVVYRRGFARLDEVVAQDAKADADSLVSLLSSMNGRAHLVGHSFGALVALVAAERVPEAVQSVVLIEPPAFSLLRNHPLLVEHQLNLMDLRARASSVDDLVQGFCDLAGVPYRHARTGVPSAVRRAAACLFQGTWPWDEELSFDGILANSIFATIVTGGRSRLLETTGDLLAESLGATRLVLPSDDHNPQQWEGFNDVLTAAWRRAENGVEG